MNTTNPLVPQGSLPSPKGKKTVHIVVLTIVAFHAVFFAGLLMQGCKPDAPQAATDVTTDPPRMGGTDLARLDTNTFYPPLPEYSAVTPSPTLSARTDITTPLDSAPLRLTPAPMPGEFTPAPPAETREYVIAKGDILASIAKANHITVGDLMKANPGIEPRRLQVGQKIQIPPASAPTASASAGGIGFTEPKSEARMGSSENLYVIKSGDTLTRIARQHNVSVRALKAANDLRTDQILVGKRLKIPAGSASASGAASGGGGLSLTNPAGMTTVR